MGEIDHLGEHLLEACSTARRRLMLCAPFVKATVLERILDVTVASVDIELFTRWRPDEVAAGVSDTAVLGIAASRDGRVFLCDRVHAKFVRFDDRVLIGSANLTATALGWTRLPNLELLMEVPNETPQLLELEDRLRSESIVATAELAEEIERIAALLPQIAAVPIEVEGETGGSAGPDRWHPLLRQPHDLYVAYSDGPQRLSRASAVAAATDLAVLELPAGLARPPFEALVASRLIQTPCIQSIDALLVVPQRFGAIRDHLIEQLGLDREAADVAWQTIMRWMLEFLPERYERRVSTWSEVLVRRVAASNDVA